VDAECGQEAEQHQVANLQHDVGQVKVCVLTCLLPAADVKSLTGPYLTVLLRDRGVSGRLGLRQ
jgi:hypothetical protein